jgi:uncharacterized protein YegL
MKKGLTAITVVLDRSGSMQATRKDAMGGFNAFVDEQKKADGEAQLTLVQFDSEYQIDYSGRDIKKVKHLTYETFLPRGSTSLYDAIGRTINTEGARLSGLPESERPENVIILVVTDGGENSSHEFTGEQVRKMTQHQQEKYNWQFIYLGSNQDAVFTAQTMGIHAANSMTYANNSQGTSAAYATMSNKVSAFRSGAGEQSLNFNDDDRKEQAEAGLSQ